MMVLFYFKFDFKLNCFDNIYNVIFFFYVNYGIVLNRVYQDFISFVKKKKFFIMYFEKDELSFLVLC